MSVPKKKTSKSRRDMRRSHLSLEKLSGIGNCKECHSPCLPHNVCPVCGKYDGKQVLSDKRASVSN